jgi:hypothetical protein
MNLKTGMAHLFPIVTDTSQATITTLLVSLNCRQSVRARLTEFSF